MTLTNWAELAAVVTAATVVGSTALSLVAKFIVSPMIERHITVMMDKIHADFITRPEVLQMREAADKEHERIAKEIDRIWTRLEARLLNSD